MASDSDAPAGASGEGRVGGVRLNLDSPVEGISVQVRGLERLSAKSLEGELRDLAGVRTVRDLLLALEQTHARLESLRVFSATASELHCGDGPNDVQVTLHLRERPRSYTAGANVNARGRVEFSLEAKVPGVGGTCSTLDVCAASSPGEGASHILSASLASPRIPAWIRRLCGSGSPFAESQARIFCHDRDTTHLNSLKTRLTGACAELRSSDGAHVLSVEAALRDSSPICDGSRIPSQSVQKQPWRGMRRVLRYAFTRNRLYPPQEARPTAAEPNEQRESLFPRNGYILYAAAEAAAAAGNSKYFKAEASAFAARPLCVQGAKAAPNGGLLSKSFSPWVLSARLSAGALWPTSPSLCLQDKFYLADAHGALRGFKPGCLGPADVAFRREGGRTDEGASVCADYLGGDAFVASEVCLSYDLGRRRRAGEPSSLGPAFHPRLFLFGSVGCLGDVLSAYPEGGLCAVKTAAARAASAWRASVGVGAAFPLLRGAWVEACLAMPVRKMPTDAVQAFQLGVRVCSPQPAAGPVSSA